MISKWLGQYLLLSIKIGEKATHHEVVNGKSLIIVPHADDELLGCYNFIINNIRDVVLFYCGFCGSNYDLENQRIRKEEFISFANTINAKYIISSENIETSLKDAINLEKPHNILLTSIVDWHFEHRKVNYILSKINSLSNNINVVLYSISIPIPLSYRNVSNEYNKSTYEEKWALFRNCYNSQMRINHIRFKIFSRFTFTRAYASEPFFMIKLATYKKCISDLTVSDDDFYQLKKGINSYSKSYKLSTILYEKIFKLTGHESI